LKQHACVGNVLGAIHSENLVDDPGPAVSIEGGAGPNGGIQNTVIRSPYQVPSHGTLVKLRSRGGAPVVNTLIDGSAFPIGENAIDVGSGCYGTRIQGVQAYNSGIHRVVTDQGRDTVVNSFAQIDGPMLELPEGRFQTGDSVYNAGDGAMYSVGDDGSWIQEKPTDRMDLSKVTGAFNGQFALDNGSNTPGNGILCIWDAEKEGWQPMNGEDIF